MGMYEDLLKQRKEIDQKLASVKAAERKYPSGVNTKKTKALVDLLDNNGFIVKSISSEQYGRQRYVYINLQKAEDETLEQSLANKKKAQNFLKSKGYRVNFNYSPNYPTFDVFIGNYDEKHDGHLSKF